MKLGQTLKTIQLVNLFTNYHTNLGKSLSYIYREVESSRLYRLVAHSRIFRMIMKWKFDAYVP